GDELVQLELDGERVLVLRALDEEHHQEGDDGGAGVDDQLPGVGEAEQRSGPEPDDDHQHGGGEGPRAARPDRHPPRAGLEGAPDARRRVGRGLAHAAIKPPFRRSRKFLYARRMGVMLQAFYWDCPRLAGVEFGWWRYVTGRLDGLRDAGFTAL